MEFSKGTDFVTIDASSIDISGEEQIRITTTGIDICNNFTISFEELAFLDGVTENIQNQFNSGIWKQKPGSSDINDIYLNNNARGSSGSGVTNLGFVGIGTDTPLAKLHVSAGSASGAMLFQPNNSAANSGGRIFFKEENDTSKNGFSIGYNGGEGDFSLNWPDNTFCFSGHNDNELGENHMTIQRDNGYVGLGVPQPQSRLHLDGDITMSGSIDMSGLIALGGATTVAGSETSLDISGDIAILPAVEGQGLHLGKSTDGSDHFWKIANTTRDSNNVLDKGLYFSKFVEAAETAITANCFVLNDNGRVGIGLNNPESKLHIYQNSTITTDIAASIESIDTRRLVEFKDRSSDALTSSIYGFIEKDTEYNNANLGIIYGVDNNSHNISFQISTKLVGSTTVPNYCMRIGYHDIEMANNVVISGTNTGATYPLEINMPTHLVSPLKHEGGGDTIYTAAYRYSDFHPGSGGKTDFTENSSNLGMFSSAPVSIKAWGSIWLAGANTGNTGGGSANVGIYISSDERIKTDIENVPDDLALEMIDNIETKYYRYKDPKTYIERKTIGFIAQNVREHIPSAVSVQPNFIPDEIRLLDNLDWSENTDGKWKLTMPDLDLSSNHTGKCSFFGYDDICGNNQSEENSIKIMVEDDKKSFIFDKRWNYLYFYGKEVDDFHTIRKEVIFTIHHSAIQELSKIKTQQSAKISILETENAQLSARLLAIESLLVKHNIN